MPKQILPYLKQCDWVLLSLALAIAAVGVAEIYSATQYELSESFYVKQIYYIILGLVMLALVVSLDYRLLSQQVPYIYLVAVLSLLLVLFVAPAIHGTRGWIPLGAFKIQPAEFAKVALVLTLARFLSEIRTHYLTSSEIIKACLLAGLPLGLILLQPDLGSAITLAPPLAVGLVLGGLRRRWILAGVVLATLITAAGWYSLKPYQKERVYTFLEPERDPRGHGYQAIQSQIAMGSGGLLGKGVTRGSQTALGFLPERHTDFIFSVVGEELGFAGSFVILAFYFLIHHAFDTHCTDRARQARSVSRAGVGERALFPYPGERRHGGGPGAHHGHSPSIAELWGIFDAHHIHIAGIDHQRRNETVRVLIPTGRPVY